MKKRILQYVQVLNLNWTLFLGLLIFTGIFINYFSDTDPFWPGLIGIGICYAIIFWVGLRADKSNDTEGQSFFLAGRNVPLYLAIFTMAATWVGGGFINGTAEATAASGLVWVQAPWGYALSLILGGIFFAGKMRRYQFRTMLDPLAQRFGEKIGAFLFIPALLGELFWTAAILTALGTTFAVVVGIDTRIALIISAVIAIFYTYLGGLWAVIKTDFIQFILLIGGLILVLPFVLNAVGGWSTVWPLYVEKFGASASFIPSKSALGSYYWNWWDYALLLIFGGIPWQVYFQRVLSAKDEKTAKWLSIIAGFICLLAAIPAVGIGVVGAVTDWSALGLEGPPDVASTLPYVIRHLCNPWVATVGLGAVAAAVMSSTDSSMLSAASLGSWNVYRPLVKPEISEKGLKGTTRKLILIIGALASLIALNIQSVYELWFLCSDFVYCLLFPPLLWALFDPKANWIGAVSGVLVAFVLRFGGGDAILGIPVLLPYPMIEDGVVLFPFRTLAMVSSLVVIPVVSRFTGGIAEPQELVVNS